MISDDYGLSRDKIAKAFSMSPNTVSGWVRVGKLKGYTVGDVKEFVYSGNKAFVRRMEPMLIEFLKKLEEELNDENHTPKELCELDANEIVKGMTDAQRSFLYYAIGMAEKKTCERLSLESIRKDLDELRERIERLEVEKERASE